MRLRGVCAGMLAALVLGAADAHAALGPGVRMDGCTSNFVFRDATDVYLGYAAHCAEDRAAPENGCAPGSLRLGTAVTVEGADHKGTLAYSSWHTMRVVGEKEIGACGYNDFALVRLHPEDHAKVDPNVPVWGGPTGLRRAPVKSLETMVSYGRSSLRADVGALKPREGYVPQPGYEGWMFFTWFATMGVFGDSGSAVLDGAGGAAGVMVTIETQMPGSNGVTNLAKALDYMRSHGGPDARLVSGTAPFKGASIPEQVESPPSQPEPAPQPAPTEPGSAPQSSPAEPPAAATPPAPASAPAPGKPAAKPAPKAKRKATRCRKRGSSRGGKARKCAKRKAAPRRR